MRYSYPLRTAGFHGRRAAAKGIRNGALALWALDSTNRLNILLEGACYLHAS